MTDGSGNAVLCLLIHQLGASYLKVIRFWLHAPQQVLRVRVGTEGGELENAVSIDREGLTE